MDEEKRTAIRAFHAAAGGEHLSEPTAEGHELVFSALPIPDGTVRVLLIVNVPGLGPLGLQPTVTADQARRMGELLNRVADR